MEAITNRKKQTNSIDFGDEEQYSIPLISIQSRFRTNNFVVSLRNSSLVAEVAIRNFTRVDFVAALIHIQTGLNIVLGQVTFSEFPGSLSEAVSNCLVPGGNPAPLNVSSLFLIPLLLVDLTD